MNMVWQETFMQVTVQFTYSSSI